MMKVESKKASAMSSLLKELLISRAEQSFKFIWDTKVYFDSKLAAVYNIVGIAEHVKYFWWNIFLQFCLKLQAPYPPQNDPKLNKNMWMNNLSFNPVSNLTYAKYWKKKREITLRKKV